MVGHFTCQQTASSCGCFLAEIRCNVARVLVLSESGWGKPKNTASNVGVWCLQWQVLFRHWLWYRIIYINVKHTVHIVIFSQISWVYFDSLSLKQLYTTPMRTLLPPLPCLLFQTFQSGKTVSEQSIKLFPLQLCEIFLFRIAWKNTSSKRKNCFVIYGSFF